MRKIKAAFFDIDGTLVSLKTKVCPPSAREALAKLRAAGVLCFIATGRSKFEIASEHLIDGLTFDGYLTNNGQDAYDAAGQLLYGTPIPQEDAEAMVDWVEREGCGCWAVSADVSRMNRITPLVSEALTAIHTTPPELGDLHPMLAHPIYKFVLFLPRERVAAAMETAPSCCATQWFPIGHDVVSKAGGKRNAMLGILARYSLSPEECIAFGDSENDIGMLQAAGIGVAMGNATPDAQAAADYVTDDCDDDGVANALRHFALI